MGFARGEKRTRYLATHYQPVGQAARRTALIPAHPYVTATISWYAAMIGPKVSQGFPFSPE
jgi:hypothetical protein